MSPTRDVTKQPLCLPWESLLEAWSGDHPPTTDDPDAPPTYHPAWVRVVHSDLLTNWPLVDDDNDRHSFVWRVPHNVYSPGHIPFHLLTQAEPCHRSGRRGSWP